MHGVVAVSRANLSWLCYQARVGQLIQIKETSPRAFQNMIGKQV
ncbi:hypothetical protein [Allopontixanthobacter confluentis]|nr:hypothetical protein [Allopontixanthobacter confluentis]